MQLDALDRQLIALLRDDSRKPTSTLAQHLGVSRGTVQNRIDRLLAARVLLGFTVRLQGDVDSGRVRAITSLEVRSQDMRGVIRALRRVVDVGRVYSTNGRWDLVVELSTESLASLDRALGEIRVIRGVALSETSILLSEVG